jgi:hypothetical protein
MIKFSEMLEDKMIRKMMLLALICMFLIPGAVWAKKEKTVIYTDNVLTDQKYHFTMKVSKDWKVKAMSEPDIERVYLEKKNYSVNQQAKSYGGDYTIPTVLIYAQDFNGTIDDFEALLKKSLEEHRTDNDLIAKLGLLMDADFVGSSDVKLDTLNARHMILKRNYKRVLTSDSFNSGSVQQADKYINDHEVHDLYVLKNGSAIIVIQMYSEREFYQESKIDFDKLINTFKM